MFWNSRAPKYLFFFVRNLNFWSKIFIRDFWRSQCLRLLRPCRKLRRWKKIKSISFHQYSWNSEVETTWISLIGWHHKTSNTYFRKNLLPNIDFYSRQKIGTPDWIIIYYEAAHQNIGMTAPSTAVFRHPCKM